MPSFGETSTARLETVHPDLQRLFREVVKGFDCTVVYGWRSVEEQQRLYAQGRTMPGAIITYKDGVTRRSKHQGVDGKQPSLAIDVMPWPLDWKDRERIAFFAGYVVRTAIELGIAMRWGGDWDADTQIEDERFVDFPHFELLL